MPCEHECYTTPGLDGPKGRRAMQFSGGEEVMQRAEDMDGRKRFLLPLPILPHLYLTSSIYAATASTRAEKLSG